jgi:hypothetical protein
LILPENLCLGKQTWHRSVGLITPFCAITSGLSACLCSARLEAGISICSARLPEEQVFVAPAFRRAFPFVAPAFRRAFPFVAPAFRRALPFVAPAFRRAFPFVAPAFRRASSFAALLILSPSCSPTFFRAAPAPAPSPNNRAFRRRKRTATRRDPIPACHGARPERSRRERSAVEQSLRNRYGVIPSAARDLLFDLSRQVTQESLCALCIFAFIFLLSSRGSPDDFYRDDEGSRRKLLPRRPQHRNPSMRRS